VSIPAADLGLPPDVLAWEYLKAEAFTAPQLRADAVFLAEVGPRAYAWGLA